VLIKWDIKKFSVFTNHKAPCIVFIVYQKKAVFTFRLTTVSFEMVFIYCNPSLKMTTMVMPFETSFMRISLQNPIKTEPTFDTSCCNTKPLTSDKTDMRF